MSGGEGGGTKKVADGGSIVPNRRKAVDDALAIINKGNDTLALFLTDCLRSVDPEFMTTIVERYMQTGKNSEKGQKLYYGQQTMFNDEGVKRSSLSDFDTPTLLHLFAFSIGTSHEKLVAGSWHPRIAERFNISSTALNKIRVLKDWRNTVEHEKKRLEQFNSYDHQTDEHWFKGLITRTILGRDESAINVVFPALLSDHRYMFEYYVLRAVKKRRNLFSDATYDALAAYIKYLREIDYQTRIRPQVIRASLFAGVLCAIAASVLTGIISEGSPSNPDGPLSKRKHMFVLLAEPLAGMDPVSVSRVLEGSYDTNDTVYVSGFVDSSDASFKEVLIPKETGLASMIERMAVLRTPMADLTKFTAALNYAFKQMMKLDTSRNDCRLIILGHVPQLPPDRQFDSLMKSGWTPTKDTTISTQWRQRGFGRPKWIFVGQPTEYDRAFFRTVMHSKDSTLLPVEHSI